MRHCCDRSPYDAAAVISTTGQGAPQSVGLEMAHASASFSLPTQGVDFAGKRASNDYLRFQNAMTAR